MPGASAASVPRTVPAASPMFTTTGICLSVTPSSASTVSFQWFPVRIEPMHMAVPVSMAGTPPSAKLATAWAGQ